ncbi:tetratricopeptide repeat protein [bacterium]|nr:tetratricopeptide repeat protein [bacterium]
MTLLACSRKAAAVCLLLLSAAAIWLADLRQGEDLLIQRQYKEAAAALQAVLPQAAPAERDRVLYLLGKARLLAGDAEGAVASFTQLQQETTSPLLAAGAFEQARAYERQGRHRQAAEIYRDRIASLIGLDRKEELAGTYLGLAELALGKDPADHARAATFFELALDLGLLPARSRAVRLKLAESYLATGKHAPAIERLQPLIEEMEPDQGRLRAMLVLGRARLQANDRAGARAVLRDLRALRPEAPESGDAAYEIALSYGVPQPAAADLERAVSALRELQQKHPLHPQAKVALFLEAQCHQNLGRGDDALRALQQFVATQADAGLGELATARAMIGDVLAAQDKLEAAIAAWRDYLKQCPSHGQWERVQRAIVEAEYVGLSQFLNGEAAA